VLSGAGTSVPVPVHRVFSRGQSLNSDPVPHNFEERNGRVLGAKWTRNCRSRDLDRKRSISHTLVGRERAWAVISP
jgi:hypothetical protein